MSVSVVSELPPPLTEPVDRDSLAGSIGPNAAACVHRVVGDDAPVFMAVSTGTRKDVGYWLLAARVSVVAVRDELLLVAPVSRGVAVVEKIVMAAVFPLLAIIGLWYRLDLLVPLGLLPPVFAAVRVRGGRGLENFVQRLPLAQLRNSRYNHVTAELLLEGPAVAELRRLRIAPFEADQLLAQIHAEEQQDA